MNSEVASNSLRHSDEGISISSRFYNKKVMVYVEGPDDIPFWNAMFRRVVSDDFFEIEAVNGKNQLTDIITKIENGSIINTFVATDLDYCLFPNDGRSQSVFVIYTYGHSIENTMFCPQNVAMYIKNAARSPHSFSEQVDSWFNTTCERVQALLPFEILNSIDIECKHHVSDGNNSIMGKGFYFYKDNTDGFSIDPHIIERETTSHPDFDGGLINRIKESLISSPQRGIRFLIQGHFIADAAMNFIKSYLRQLGLKGNFSSNDFYMAFFDCYAKCPSLCHDKTHVYNYIKRAVDAYNRQNALV